MKLLSPAKINLFLHITGRRPDGYHELVSLMSCIGLHDQVSLTFNTGKTSVTCRHPDVPNDEGNIAYRAAACFFKALGKADGVEIFIDKHIPVAAGLGGGSSNAASVLLGLNDYYENPFSRDDLKRMGLSLGADVPFFICRKPALASGIGEKLAPYPWLKPYHILLIFQGIGISTAQVYKNLNLALTNRENENKYYLFKDKKFNVACHLSNDLETVTTLRYPQVVEAKAALMSYGAEGALMSGSGPTVFGLFTDAKKASNARKSLVNISKWQFCLTQLLV